MRYVIQNEENEIFLGEFLGMVFWSLMGSFGQDDAVTFDNEDIARSYASTWKDGSNIKIISIETTNQYATKSECVKAGLPSWES